MKRSDVLFLMAAIYLAQVVSKEEALAFGIGCVLIAFIFKHRGN